MGVALGVAPAGSEELGTAAAGPFEGSGGGGGVQKGEWHKNHISVLLFAVNENANKIGFSVPHKNAS